MIIRTAPHIYPFFQWQDNLTYEHLHTELHRRQERSIGSCSSPALFCWIPSHYTTEILHRRRQIAFEILSSDK